eukprot:GFUD01044587.1.p1 GENE.GFUD01044587.1~~GFUD01044587.1.p1  ORF type:complete len:281 (-),score=74.58 GFUD01044587.1:153-995(-)
MEENNNMTSYRQKCVDFGVHTNKFLLAKMDTREVEKMMAEQIREVGGSQWLYKDINKNMKNGIFDPFFLREHCNLYSWRETFFDAHFAGNSWFTVESDQYGEEEEDYFSWDDPFTRFITIPVQLALHFDAVLVLAAAKIEPELKWLKSHVFFRNDEIISNEAESKFKFEIMISDLHKPELVIPEGSLVGHSLKDHYDQVNLTFSDVAHIIVEMYQKGPKKLEELSIKTILQNNLSMEKLPLKIQKKVAHGMYAVEGRVPENITDEGKVIFEKIRKEFNKK